MARIPCTQHIPEHPKRREGGNPLHPPVPTHFLSLHLVERPFGGLTWPQVLALAASAPIGVWCLLTPISPFLRALVLAPLATIVFLLGHQDLLEDLRALALYPLTPRRHLLTAKESLGVFRP